MTTHQEKNRALQRARPFMKYSGVHAIGWGFKYKKGKRTKTMCVIFSVEKKESREAVAKRGELLPSQLSCALVQGSEPKDGSGWVVTDVIERPRFEAQLPSRADVQGVPTAKHRPVPGGVSLGHPDITAGTLGAWVRVMGDLNNYYALTNAHVAADTNKGSIGSNVYQPGPTDGGKFGDQIGTLSHRVQIHFGDPGEPDPPKKDDKDEDTARLTTAMWAAWLWPANLLARAVGCPMRAMVLNPRNQRRVTGASQNVIDQPFPNLVDAALVHAREPIESFVLDQLHTLGEINGFQDFQLGDRAIKEGRTTVVTRGECVETDVLVSVSYGPDGVAQFQNQKLFRADSGEFSAGGDSGSVILHEESRMVGALLFAGGGGTTVGNSISDVIRLLGISV